jgi:hypothetical protein
MMRMFAAVCCALLVMASCGPANHDASRQVLWTGDRASIGMRIVVNGETRGILKRNLRQMLLLWPEAMVRSAT